MLACTVKRAEKHTKDTKEKIRKIRAKSRGLMRINMDNEVVPGMNKGPEEMALEICFAAVVK